MTLASVSLIGIIVIASALMATWTTCAWYERLVEDWFGYLERCKAGEGAEMRRRWRYWRGDDPR